MVITLYQGAICRAQRSLGKGSHQEPQNITSSVYLGNTGPRPLFLPLKRNKGYQKERHVLGMFKHIRANITKSKYESAVRAFLENAWN
jgi:hypothetical protein